MRLDFQEVIVVSAHVVTVPRGKIEAESGMQSAPPRAEITIYSPLITPFRQPLVGPSVSIGRSSECSIPIKDRYLSRRHAEIIAKDGEWTLKDLGSANGTYLNGTRVEQDLPLHSGDRIRIGDTELVFLAAEQSTDRFLAVGDHKSTPTISIPVRDIEDVPKRADTGPLQVLNALARELLEDRPMHELFGFIVGRVMQHLKPSRAALGLLAPDGQSFIEVEVKRQDDSDKSELRISQTVLSEVVHGKKALAFMDVASDARLNRAESIVMQGIHSILCAPLLINNQVVGVLYVDYKLNQRPTISEDDVKLVAQVARVAAIKLETTRLREEAIQKRLIDEELKTASAIQQRLLAPPPKDIAGYTFSGWNRPCRTVSGDYYDFVVRPNGRLYFVIGDVSGKGVTAGLLMAGLQASFRVLAKNDPDPATLVAQLNLALKENLPASAFVTLFLARLDIATGDLEYTNAGQTLPLHVERDKVSELGDTDIVLGVVRSASYSNRRARLEHGDSLVLYTDGVSESENAEGAEFSPAGIAKAIQGMHGRPAQEVARTIDDAVVAYVGGSEMLPDDVTLVVVSRQ
jgi:sigma-B regulation protein RsbU (phosphoserine phosphatase)